MEDKTAVDVLKEARPELFVGAMNDGLFIIDREPRPAPNDIGPRVTAGPRVFAKMAGNDAAALALAKKMAAAPELLEALEGLLSECVEYARINNIHNSDGSPATNHAMRRARAAISRASR